jgi:hypothetical protein
VARGRLHERDALVVLGAVGALAALVAVPPRLPASPTVDRVQRVVRVAQDRALNADLFDAETEGYYEGLLDAAGRNAGAQPAIADLFRVATPAATRPRGWKRLHETDAVDRTDEYLRFTLRPNLDMTYKDAPFLTNRWGHRDDPVELEAAPGVRRIALVGASIAMGSGVRHDETFGERLENALDRRHAGDGARGYEVVNFSVAGYRMTQLMDVVIDRVPPFEPDVVVLVLSDIGVNPRWWLHLVTLVSHGADLKHDRLRALVDEAGIRRGQRRSIMAERLAPHRDETLAGCLREMIASVRSSGAALVAVTVPQPGHADVLDERVEPLRAVLAEERVPVVELITAFDAVDDPRTLWVRPYDRHPTSDGHRMLFEMLYDGIVSDRDTARAVLGPAYGSDR